MVNLDGYRITVTTSIEFAVEWIKKLNVKYLCVDLEANMKTGFVNCVTLVPVDSNIGLLYHGNIHHTMPCIYYILEEMRIIQFCFDETMEMSFPRLVDLRNEVRAKQGFLNNQNLNLKTAV
jgi:hypothetical protein